MFSACLKKEFIEAKRTKNFFMTLGIAAALSLMGLFTVLMLAFLKDYISADQLGEFAVFFQSNYATSFMYFASFMATYFIIVIIIFFCGAISQEINKKQWILPINSGIKPSYLIGAKILSTTLIVVISYIFAALINFVFTILLFDSGGFDVLYLIKNSCFLLIFITFLTIMLVSLNAISKKRWIPVVITLITLIVLTKLLNEIKIGGYTLVSFTPLNFYQIVMASFDEIQQFNMTQWLSMSISTVLISAGFIIWAVSSTKIKAEKTTNFFDKFRKKIKKVKPTV